MIIALFALSIAMIVGGIASVVQGFPFVRLESGLAMTIAGATTASAGAVLLGLAVLAGQVKGVARRLAEAATALPPVISPPRESSPREFVPHTTLPDVEPAESKLQASRRPVIAGATGLAAGTALGASLGSPETRARPEPSFEEPSFEEPAASSPAEPLLPDLLPPHDAVSEPVHDRSDDKPHDASSHAADVPANEAGPEAADADLFAPTEPPALRPALDDTPAVAPASEEAALPETPPQPALQVVGTYVSGGNTYVMFSDGSIEAETPRGRFTFESLEELKAFVEAGGEGENRGVA